MMRFRRPLLLLAVTLLTLLAPPAAWAEDRLIYVVAIIRHGDRTPYAAPGANVHCTWPARAGELTPLGMRQEYELGQGYRAAYIDGEHLLPATYDPATLRVVSTPMNRTVMSAGCMLNGLYPPGTGPRLADGQPALPNAMQVVPVYTIPDDVGNYINPGQVAGPTRDLLMRALQEPDFARLQTAHQADLARWGEAIGCKLTTLVELMRTADYLYCMLTHDQPMPAGLTRDEARRVVDLGFGVLAALYARADVSRSMTAVLLSKVLASLREAARGEGPAASRKMDVYSGHDVTLLALMAVLKHPLPTNVPYASHMELELLAAEDGRHRVRVRYNGKLLALDDAGAQTVPLEQLEESVRGITSEPRR